MRRARGQQSRALKKRKPVDLKHPLIGTWVQKENPFDTTAAVFTVAVKQGRFLVSGVDEGDGIAFKISSTRWDGERLHFVSFYPPTNHTARHALRLTGKGRANHRVSYRDEEGTFVDDQLWLKRPYRKRTPR
jgi:hypothetical protein